MTRGLGWLTALVMLAALLAPAGAAAAGCTKARHPGGDWPVPGGDLRNSRSQPRETTIGPGNVSSLRPAWEANVAAVAASGSFTSTPVIAGGCLYIGSTSGWVLALNADTGDLVWKTKLPQAINNSVTVDRGEVFAISGLRVAALDRATGKVRWLSRFIDEQEGSETYGSPMLFTYRGKKKVPARRILIAGVSGGGAEIGDEETRYKFQGNVVLIDGDTGKLLRRIYVIPRREWKDGYAGGGVWATPAIDRRTGHAFVGTGNPFQPEVQHERTNAIIKIDMSPARRTFGRIVGHYTGTLDEYVEDFADMPCVDVPGNPAPWYPQGAGACMDQDLDFGASPNLFKDAKGRLLVGEGQKSGEYHVVSARTMKRRYVSLLGAPLLVGGVVGNTAVDDDSVFGPITVGGYLWSIQRRGGGLRWLTPTGDGIHYALATTVANGVVYSLDLAGLLRAYDADTGVQLAAFPQSRTAPVATNLGGGVAVARNTVYGVSGTAVVAHRP